MRSGETYIQGPDRSLLFLDWAISLPRDLDKGHFSPFLYPFPEFLFSLSIAF